MPTTSLAAIPYPGQDDAPNGPDQMMQLAQRVEPFLVNKFTNATDRSNRWPARDRGALSWRDDDKLYEFWDGTAWVGLERAATLSNKGTGAGAAARQFSTTETGALSTATAKITNPSPIYRMHWIAVFDMWVKYTWKELGQGVIVYHKTKAPTTLESRPWVDFTSNGTNRIFTGSFPARSGYLAPNTSVSVSSYFTIKKTGKGTLTLNGGATEVMLFGVTTP